MAVAAVSFDGVRVNDSTSATNWGNFSSSGGAPASEAQLAYQGGSAVNKKVTETTGRGGVDYDPASGAVDMTLATRALWFAKCVVADFGDLNTTYGCELAIGSSNANYYSYNVAGSGANRGVYNTYPAQGGYLITAINPSIAAWRDTTAGSPSLTAIDWFGFAAQFATGGAKSENVALDALDIGTGLSIVGGDGASADGTFADFLSFDQGTTGNRYGVITGASPSYDVHGMLVIGGGGTATEFSDNNAIVSFLDGYHGAGDVGITVNLDNALNAITLGIIGIGLGSATTENTKPDFIVSGTSGSAALTFTLRNFRNVALTSACTLNGGAVVGCEDFAQGSASVSNATIRTNSASGVACCDDPDFTNLDGVSFVQDGSGYALEITSPGSYTLNDILFSGYGGTPGSNGTANSGANDAAIYNNSGGAVTLNIVGGDSPSVRNGAGATTTVSNSAQVTFTGLAAGGEFRLYDNDGDANPITLGTNREGVESLTGTTYTLVHDKTEAGNIVYAQFIDPLNFEEQVRAVTLAANNQSIEFDLEPEINV